MCKRSTPTGSCCLQWGFCSPGPQGHAHTVRGWELPAVWDGGTPCSSKQRAPAAVPTHVARWETTSFLPPQKQCFCSAFCLFSLLCCAFQYAIKCSHSFWAQLHWAMLPYCQSGAIKDCRTFLQKEACACLKKKKKGLLGYFQIFTLNLSLSVTLCYGALPGDDVIHCIICWYNQVM